MSRREESQNKHSLKGRQRHFRSREFQAWPQRDRSKKKLEQECQSQLDALADSVGKDSSAARRSASGDIGARMFDMAPNGIVLAPIKPYASTADAAVDLEAFDSLAHKRVVARQGSSPLCGAARWRESVRGYREEGLMDLPTAEAVPRA